VPSRPTARAARPSAVVPAFSILIFTALGVMTEAGKAGIMNTGPGGAPHPHGFSEVMYAYSSATGNNGSAFAGLTAYSTQHPVFYSLTLAIAMFVGRFPLIIAALAIAGNMAKKKRVPLGPGSFPVHGGLFVGLLIGTVLIVGALTFFPALAMGPIVEHVMMNR
jgi:K+-transporting ATPase ATPase A chain